MTIVVHEEQVANAAFSNDEDEDGTSVSSKGPFKKSPQIDQSTKSPFKKFKKKKVIVAQRVFVSTKT
jgi:hypothetical protein